MKKETAEVMAIRLLPAERKALEKYAAKMHITTSEAIRRFIEKGLEIDGYIQDETKIRGYIRDELETVAEPLLDRIIKLQLKSARASAAVLYANAANLADFYAAETEFENVLAIAFMNAAKYLKYKEEPFETYIKQAKELAQSAKEIKNVNDN